MICKETSYINSETIVIVPFYCRIEWVAYDLHSGLKSIYWKLLDNYTGEDIIHGHEDIPSQGGAKVCKIFISFYIFFFYVHLIHLHAILSIFNEGNVKVVLCNNICLNQYNIFCL